MTEGEFIRFYKKRNNSKNLKTVKEKIDLFWNVLLKALDEDKKVILKNWGVFEKRERKVRKVLVPTWEKAQYIKPKEIVKFRAGKNLIKMVEGDTNE